MPIPFTPADAKALIPDPSSSLCGNFVRSLLRLPVLFYQFINHLFDSSGNPTKAAVNLALPPGSYLDAACLLTEDGSKLLCDGREMAQATYPDLYSAIGATYGAAAAGNFKLPDFRGKFPVGIGTFTAAGTVSIGTAVGADQVRLVEANIPAHNHVPDPGAGAHSYLLKAPYAGSITGSDTVNSGSEQAVGPGDGMAIASYGQATPDKFNIIPPALGVYRYIVC